MGDTVRTKTIHIFFKRYPEKFAFLLNAQQLLQHSHNSGEFCMVSIYPLLKFLGVAVEKNSRHIII